MCSERAGGGEQSTLGIGDRSLGDGSDAGAGGGEKRKRWRTNTCVRHVAPCGTPISPPSPSHAFIIFSSTQTTTTTTMAAAAAMATATTTMTTTRIASAISRTGFSSPRSSPFCPSMPLLNYFKPLSRCNMTTHRLWEKKCARRCHRPFVWYRCRKHGIDIYSLEESPRERKRRPLARIGGVSSSECFDI